MNHVCVMSAAKNTCRTAISQRHDAQACLAVGADCAGDLFGLPPEVLLNVRHVCQAESGRTSGRLSELALPSGHYLEKRGARMHGHDEPKPVLPLLMYCAWRKAQTKGPRSKFDSELTSREFTTGRTSDSIHRVPRFGPGSSCVCLIQTRQGCVLRAAADSSRHRLLTHRRLNTNGAHNGGAVSKRQLASARHLNGHGRSAGQLVGERFG